MTVLVWVVVVVVVALGRVCGLVRFTGRLKTACFACTSLADVLARLVVRVGPGCLTARALLVVLTGL